ncbi:hypothetical protein Taro_003920 [Colocasia esculenta]|uniref:Uncharacterized protein n=1 Tax=Colocasia esculenta TaxID=4460 RepID=A0A843TQ45_COLES|nr:hypothetical protein [Colocasia esculenta]
MLTSALRRQRPIPSRSGRDGWVRRVLNRKQFLTLVGQPELGKLCLARGRSLSGALALVALVERVAHKVSVVLRVGYPRFCVSQARVFVVLGVSPSTVCTVEICVVFLDTLTPVFKLYVRLRERRQWDSDLVPKGVRHGPTAVWSAGVVLVGLHCSLALLCGCRAAVEPFVRDYETKRLVEVLPVVVCPGGGTILVVVPLWYLVVVGVEVDFYSVELMPVLLPFVGWLLVKLVASVTSCCNDLPVRLVA